MKIMEKTIREFVFTEEEAILIHRAVFRLSGFLNGYYEFHELFEKLQEHFDCTNIQEK